MDQVLSGVLCSHQGWQEMFNTDACGEVQGSRQSTREDFLSSLNPHLSHNEEVQRSLSKQIWRGRRESQQPIRNIGNYLEYGKHLESFINKSEVISAWKMDRKSH